MSLARLVRSCRALAVPALALAAPAAHAQSLEADFVSPNLPIEYDRGRNTGVLDRQRPEFEAAGIRLGAFILRPRAELRAGWSSNVYQTPAKVADGYFEISPSGTFTSNWSRHEFGIEAQGSFRRYLHETRRNQDGWRVGGHGRLDLGTTDAVRFEASRERASEPVTSVAYPGAAAEASQYLRTHLGLAPSLTRGRFRFELAYDYSRLGFSPVLTFAGLPLDQTNRNSFTHALHGRIEYAITPDTSLFVQGGFDAVSYLVDLAPGIANRNSHSYRVLVGGSFDLAARVRGAVALGYMARDYRDPRYARIAGLSLEARVDWFVDSLTTISLTGRRVIEDASFAIASGYVNSSVALRVDHELYRNVLLDLQLAYEHDSFMGTTASANILRVSGGARYLFDRSFGIGIAVQHDSRNASGNLGLASFNETRLMLSLVAQR